LNGVENNLERILQRHIPSRLRDGFVFHATEIFNGGKTLKREKDNLVGPREWPIERRLAIAEEIMELPTKFKLPIAIGFTERAAFPRALNLPKDFPESEQTLAAHVATYMNCAMMAEHWMRKETTNENCLVVVENNDEAKQLGREPINLQGVRWRESDIAPIAAKFRRDSAATDRSYSGITAIVCHSAAVRRCGPIVRA